MDYTEIVTSETQYMAEMTHRIPKDSQKGHFGFKCWCDPTYCFVGGTHYTLHKEQTSDPQ